jgi:hypothetical protein
LVVGIVVAAVFVGAVLSATVLFEDTVHWGPDGGHHVTTPERGRVVDFEITDASLFVANLCNPDGWTNELTTNVFTGELVAPGTAGAWYVCLRNTGGSKAQPIDVEVSITNVTDTEVACTGQEADFDTTCVPDAAGEAGAVLDAEFREVDCSTATNVGPSYPFGFFSSLSTVALPSQAYSTPRCYTFRVAHQNGLNEAVEQAAQSDSLHFTVTVHAAYSV